MDKVAVDEFFTHLNQIQSSIKFAMKSEKDNCIFLLDISITRNHTKTLDRNIYQNPIHSERYLNFKSEHPLEKKSAVVYILTHIGPIHLQTVYTNAFAHAERKGQR